MLCSVSISSCKGDRSNARTGGVCTCCQDGQRSDGTRRSAEGRAVLNGAGQALWGPASHAEPLALPH